MENKTSRNSIILRNLNSPYFEQAIFIMKKGGNDAVFCDDIVDEAQRIIDNFIKQRAKRVSRTKKLKAILFAVPAVFISAVAIFVWMRAF